MNLAGYGAMATGIGTFLLGIAALVRARVKPGDPVRLEVRSYKAEVRSLRRELALADALLEDVRRDLRHERAQVFRMTDELSEARTVIAALRKLIPSGEWWERLGIGTSPSNDNDDTDSD